MLNISPNTIDEDFNQYNHKSLRLVNSLTSGNVFKRIMTVFFGVGFAFMFLPWTQNIRADGNVTTLSPDERPQNIHSIIAGRIEKWYVTEGEFVNKGDTILFLSEIKDDYFDPQLLDRTKDQVDAKTSSVTSYESKIQSLERQITALKETQKLKLQQVRNKVEQSKLKVLSDSMDYNAAKINYDIALEQFNRMQSLYEKGLKSLTDLENRKNKMQEAKAKMISAENKLLTSRNELINSKVEINSIDAQYMDDISKAESEKFTALSNMFDAKATVTKLENQLKNYSVRFGYYYILAPIDGYITKAIQVGVGETIKEGASIVSLMPSYYNLSVQMYIDPIDLPLIEKGQEVRIQFDGWPAIVFSGWPNTSYGTYGGRVFAVDNFISDNGKFRVLVIPDETDHNWPEALRVGGGTNNMLLLKEVPIWYELWRQINGFPPDFYKSNMNKGLSSDLK